MAKILVTGATGRLGANVVRHLAQAGHTLRCLVLPGDPQAGKLDNLGVEIFWASLTEADKLRAAVEGMDQVVHLAAIMDEVPAGMNRVQYFDINTRGSFALVNAAAELGVRRFVYTSSTATYDIFTARDVPIREDSPLRPKSDYGVTKVTAEAGLLAMACCHDLSLVILRPSYIMACDEALGLGGVGNVTLGLQAAREPWCAFGTDGPVAATRELEEKARRNPGLNFIPYNANGLPWHWHVTDVRDVVQAVHLALEREEVTGEVFNIAGPRPTCFEEAVKYKCRCLDQEWETVDTGVYWRLEFDISKARRLLGYAPVYDVIRMIDDAIAYRAGKDLGVIPALLPAGKA